MKSRFLLVAAAVPALLLAGAAWWVRSLVDPAAVKAAIERQATAALERPVRVGAAGVGFFPKVSLRLDRLMLGEPGQVEVGRMEVKTGLGGLLSRRVEGAEIRLSSARLKLPLSLPRSTPAGGPTGGASAAFTITSVDRVEIEDLEIEGGYGEKLRGDLKGSLDGERLRIGAIDLHSGKTILHGSADLDSYKTLAGTFDLKAKTLDVDGLVRLLSALVPGEAEGRRAPSPAVPAGPLAGRMEGSLTAERGSYRGISFQDLQAKIEVASSEVSIASMQVKLLGGHYGGRAKVGLGPALTRVTYHGELTGLDVAALADALGDKGTASGKLSARLEFQGTGGDSAAIQRRGTGSGDVTVARLHVKGLDLLGPAAQYLGGGTAKTNTGAEPGEMTAHFTIAQARIASSDLRLVQPDLELRARGSVGLDGSLDLAGDLVLSEGVSEAFGGRDARYLKEGNRIVLPVKLGGALAKPAVTIDVAALAGRAAKVAASEATKKATDSLQKMLFGGKK